MVFAMNSTQLVLALLGLAISLLLLIWVMRRRYHRQNLRFNNKKARNKYPEVDLFRYRPAFLKIGLASALLVSILAFSWTEGPLDNRAYFEVGEMEPDIEMIPPRTIPPKQKTPPPPSIIEEVEEEEILEDEEVEFIDMSITDDDAVYDYEPEKKPAPAPMPAAPPPMEAEKEYGEIHIRAEEMPSFGKCSQLTDREAKWSCTQQEMLQFVYKNINYPAVARENGVEGNVVAAFVIDQEGQLTQLELLRDIGAGCGEEVKRIVGLMNKQLDWSPGRQQGRPVKVRVTLPVRFKLQ